METSIRSALAACVIATCACTQAIAVPGQWADCAGELIETASGQKLTFAQIAETIRDRGLVLFGERHGTPEHAAASACVLSALAMDGAPTALVMEMLSVQDQPTIDAWRLVHPERVAGLGVALEWWRRPWPAFSSWLPLIERAFGLRARLLGGDLGDGQSADDSRTIDALKSRLPSRFDYIVANWAGAMKQAHCNLISEDEANALALRQVQRDASMAGIAEEALSGDKSVLLHVGRGHARKDRSLYTLLLNETKRSHPLTIAAFTSGRVPKVSELANWDYVWVAGSVAETEDPCTIVGALSGLRAFPLAGEGEARQ